MATVRLTNTATGETRDVPGEVAAALLAGNYGPWTRDGADEARIAELEAELAKLKGEPAATNDPADSGQED